MPINDPLSGLPLGEVPMVEVWLEIGDSLRLGDRVLRVLDTDGEDTMLRVESVTRPDPDETHWAELPR
jgi:hypothetical protein